MEPQFSIIVCHDIKNGIAKKGKIPWNLKEDMKHFKETTINNTVIMGRTTWDTLSSPYKPLPNRFNIILSHNLSINPSNPLIAIAKDFDQAINLALTQPKRKIFIIGGASIYKIAIQDKRCTELIITKIHEDYDCDVFFPEYLDSWIQKEVEHQGSNYIIVKYQRKNHLK